MCFLLVPMLLYIISYSIDSIDHDRFEKNHGFVVTTRAKAQLHKS